MKRSQRTSLEFNVKEHEFLISLETIRTTQRIGGIYTLQFQKGCKHLQSINEPIQFDRSIYVFQQSKPIVVRVHKERSMLFAWSLYKIVDNMLQFVDIFNFNLQEGYTNYLEEIRGLSFEYSRICQQKELGNELGASWKLMKLHLKNHQFRQILKSTTGTFTLECTVAIRNEFDRITEVESRKTQKKIEVDVQEKSTSSRNSLKDKKKVRIMDGEKIYEKQVELKVQSMIKTENEPHFDVEKQNGTSQQNNETWKVSTPTYLPIQQTLLKSRTILSDIIEASNQGESHLNLGDKSDRKPSECILQPPSEAKCFTKTKTYHFENNQRAAEPIRLKRNNSYEEFRRSHEEQEDIHNELIRVSEGSECSKDQLTKESTLIRTDLTETVISPLTESKRKTHILLIFVLYFLLGGFLCSQMKGQLDIATQFPKKGSKIRKDEFSFKMIFQSEQR